MMPSRPEDRAETYFCLLGIWHQCATRLQVLDEVIETRGRPDAALYATIVEGLWQSGRQPERLRALRRFDAAMQGNVHGLAASISGSEAAVEACLSQHPRT